MTSRISPGARGQALLSVIAWILAGIGVAVAAATWLRGAREDSASSSAAREPDDVRQLRLALSTAEMQNSALRRELDRLLTNGGDTAKRSPAGPGGDATTAEPVDPALREMSSRIGDAVTRAATQGDPDSNRQAAISLMEAFRLGREGYPALRDAYLAAADPKARSIILPTLMFVGGEQARDLVFEQLAAEKDAELRETLLSMSVKYATPDQAAKVKDVYLETLRSGDEREQGARTAAIRGLRYAKGPDVQEALLQALSDPSEEVRIAALGTLGSRIQVRDRIREMLERESSPLVRQVGECALLVNDR